MQIKIVFNTIICYITIFHCFQCIAQQTATTNINWQTVKVLVYTKNGKGYVHDNIPSAIKCIKELGRQYGFLVDASDNPADFTDANLKKFSALIFASTNNNVFDNDEEKLALMHYIEAGGGLVGIHSATGTERKWPWFKRLIGATFDRHPPYQALKEIIVDSTNPSTSFLPHVWQRNDECYYVKEINPDLHILMVHDLSVIKDSSKPAPYGDVFPSAWCHEYDGGRVWYTALGHDSTVYEEPVFRKHIMGGLTWVINHQRALDYTKAYAKTTDDPLPY